jgi:hypothetical protein
MALTKIVNKLGASTKTDWIICCLLFAVLSHGCATSQQKLPPEPVKPSPGFEQTLLQVDNIAIERPRYPITYVIASVDIVGTYDRMLTSPRMMMSSIRAEAETALLKLRIQFPQENGSAIDTSLNMLKSQAIKTIYANSRALDIEEKFFSRTGQATYNDAMYAAQELDRAILEMRLLITRIQERLASNPTSGH